MGKRPELIRSHMPTHAAGPDDRYAAVWQLMRCVIQDGASGQLLNLIFKCHPAVQEHYRRNPIYSFYFRKSVINKIDKP